MYAQPLNTGNREGREGTDIDAHYLVRFIYLEGQRDLKRKKMITALNPLVRATCSERHLTASQHSSPDGVKDGTGPATPDLDIGPISR